LSFPNSYKFFNRFNFNYAFKLAPLVRGIPTVKFPIRNLIALRGFDNYPVVIALAAPPVFFFRC
jgi:hypothetical protein